MNQTKKNLYFIHRVCVDIDIFSMRVILLIGDLEQGLNLIDENSCIPVFDEARLLDELQNIKKKIDEESKTQGGYNAFTARIGLNVVIYAPKPIALSTLVHEVSHAVDAIFRVTECNDGELRAYLSAYLFVRLAVKNDNIIKPPSKKGKQK